jgi:hypothetical protein
MGIGDSPDASMADAKREFEENGEGLEDGYLDEPKIVLDN